jgi:hypothetical protein
MGAVSQGMGFCCMPGFSCPTWQALAIVRMEKGTKIGHAHQEVSVFGAQKLGMLTPYPHAFAWGRAPRGSKGFCLLIQEVGITEEV